MAETTITNMVMLTNPETGEVLVIDRVKKYPGIAFPGGHAEKGESIYDSAVREVLEETGYTAQALEPCGFIYWDNADGSRYFTYFYKTSTFSGTLSGGTEEGRVFWVRAERLPEMRLAPNMDKYMRMFSEKHSECYCLECAGGYEVTYR